MYRPCRSTHPRRRFRNRPRFLEPLEPRQLLAAVPVISEFLASNESGIVDGFGESSDWIEIYNAGDTEADLSRYNLTDDADNLGKWTFPDNTTVGPGEYLVVFASGRDTSDPQGQLHTSFRLSAAGEYVALTDPALQIVSQFGPDGADFPDQVADVSFGTYVGRQDQILLDPLSTAQVRVPTDNGLQNDWYLPEFQADASWQTGAAAIGFDQFANQGVPVSGGTAVLRLDFGDDDSGETGEADTEATWTTMTLADNGLTIDGVTVNVVPLGGIPLDDRDRTAPVDNPPSLTIDQLFDDFIFARSQTDDTGIEIQLSGLVPGQDYEMTLWSFDVGSVNARISTWTEVSGAQPIEIESTYQFDGNRSPSADLDNTMTASLTASATGELRIQGRRNGGTSFGVFINALQLVVPSISSAVNHDITNLMTGVGSSAYLRVPFAPTDPNVDLLTLSIQYDSGFVAYLNGTEVARRDTPAGSPLSYDAEATNERTATETLQTETIDLSAFTSLLRSDRENLLAIHGLNTSPTDNDFLIRPELTASTLGIAQSRYFATPSPGTVNGGETFEGMVSDTSFSVDRGFYDSPQQVVIGSSTPGASLVYTLDGSAPSETNGTRVDPASNNDTPSAIVPVETTTYLRAIGVKDGYLPTNVDTQSYIFLDDVIRQDITPETGDPRYPATWQSRAYTADYQVDPEIVAQWDDNNPANLDTGIREALQSIPTMSIVMDHDDLWDSRSGIYPRAQSSGEFWRRSASVEYMDPNTGEQFQVNAGVQMHGGASRDNERTKKHSFRLLFKEEFGGPSTLKFPLFKDSPLEEFNTIVLKSFFTDGFPTRTATGRYSPLDSQYTRDTWMRDVRLAMGGLDASSEYVHLYINGLYWGLYSPTERPDDAFMASYLGGERDDYDIIKDFNELFRGSRSAWNEMFSIANDGLVTNEAYQRIQGKNPDGTPNSDLPNYLDVPDLTDFMITHLYAGAEDWPHHNWYAGRDRNGETSGFRFFTWDQEIVLDGRYRDRTNVSNNNTPARLYSQLRRNDEFKLQFADRVYKNLFNEGPLATENAQALWMRRADQIESAIIAESARWGDAREGEVRRIDDGGPRVTIPVMTVDLWRAERDNVRDIYFSRSHELAIQRFRADGLFPVTEAPVFSPRGGFIRSDTDIVLTGSGQIYYTLDGSDPREIGGAVRADAVLYDGPFRMTADDTVTTRTIDGGEWSPIDRVTFEVDKIPADASNFRVSELHYRPAIDGDTEFIEWVNVGTQAISMTGVSVGDAVDFDFRESSISNLQPGERLLIVRNADRFAEVYPDAVGRVAGVYQGSLSNGGESLVVQGYGDSLIQQLTYDDDIDQGWPVRSDGQGYSLQALNPLVDCESNVNCNWRSSAVVGGTPGDAEYPVGDSNLDRLFDSSDLILVFQVGEYENGIKADSDWAEGDWSGDGDFTTTDLVLAFAEGSYVAAAGEAFTVTSASASAARPEITSRVTNIDAAAAIAGDPMPFGRRDLKSSARTGRVSDTRRSDAEDRIGQHEARQHRLRQHSTGQHSTGQHSTGQHSMGPHRRLQDQAADRVFEEMTNFGDEWVRHRLRHGTLQELDLGENEA